MISPAFAFFFLFFSTSYTIHGPWLVHLVLWIVTRAWTIIFLLFLVFNKIAIFKRTLSQSFLMVASNFIFSCQIVGQKVRMKTHGIVLDHIHFWKAFDDFRYNQWVGLLSLSWSKLSFRIKFSTINGKTIPSCFSSTFDLTEPSGIILKNNNNNNKTTLLFSITNSHAFLSSNHYDLRLRRLHCALLSFFSFFFKK